MIRTETGRKRPEPPGYPERIAKTLQRLEAHAGEEVEVLGVRSDDRHALELAIHLGLRSRRWEQTVLLVDADPEHSQTMEEVVLYQGPTVADIEPGAGRDEVLASVHELPHYNVHAVIPAEDGRVEEHLEGYLDVLGVLATEHTFVVVALPDLTTPAGEALAGHVDTLLLGSGQGAGREVPETVRRLGEGGRIWYVPRPGDPELPWRATEPFPEDGRRYWERGVVADKNFAEFNRYFGTLLHHTLHRAVLPAGGLVYGKDLPEGVGLDVALRRRYGIRVEEELAPLLDLLHPRLGTQPEAAGDVLATLLRDREGLGLRSRAAGPLELLELAEKARLVIP